MEAGGTIQSLLGYSTFIPNPLPPPIVLSTSTLRRIAEAGYLLGQVEMCRTLLPNADLIVYSSLQREAIASSTIEGTIASPDELVLFQASRYAETDAVREVDNYRQTLEWGFQQLSHRNLTINLICGLHERLLSSVRGEASAGRLKDQQNAIRYRPEGEASDTLFYPCPPERVQELMETLEQYLLHDQEELPVVQCALAHYQFETIHPFGDGNGRVGRLLIVLHLIRLGLLSAPLIYPSVFFEHTRNEYIGHLQAVRDQGAWEEWIAYFASAIKHACQDTLRFTQTIVNLRQNLHSEVTDVRRRASHKEVLDTFFEEPVLSVRQICDRTRLTHKTVQTALDSLRHLNLVYEITQREKGRVYACIPVLEAIFEREFPKPSLTHDSKT